jgi:hypothetical protein
MQANKYPQAIQLMEKARASGALKKESGYVNLAKLYLITGQNSADPKPNALKAEQVLKEGMSKGVVTASSDNYMLLGETAELADQTKSALAAYTSDRGHAHGRKAAGNGREGQGLAEKGGCRQIGPGRVVAADGCPFICHITAIQ